MSLLPQAKKEGAEDIWYTDGRSQGNLPLRHSCAIQLDSNVLLFEEGTKQSSQWAELRVLWVVLVNT